ncbi:MAG: GNAT family N-acetyltransferase [Acidobacteriota bacterium]
MQIRLATKSDSVNLIAFNQAMAMETENKRLDSDILSAGVLSIFEDDRKGFYVVAESGERIVGGLMITYEWSDWRSGWFWWIQSVYIEPEYRGQGIYSELYSFVKNRAREVGGVCGFRLYVEKDNRHAQDVYRKLGMEETYYQMFEEKL